MPKSPRGTAGGCVCQKGVGRGRIPVPYGHWETDGDLAGWPYKVCLCGRAWEVGRMDPACGGVLGQACEVSLGRTCTWLCD